MRAQIVPAAVALELSGDFSGAHDQVQQTADSPTRSGRAVVPRDSAVLIAKKKPTDGYPWAFEI
jgi:hypothetical protein